MLPNTAVKRSSAAKNSRDRAQASAALEQKKNSASSVGGSGGGMVVDKSNASNSTVTATPLVKPSPPIIASTKRIKNPGKKIKVRLVKIYSLIP